MEISVLGMLKDVMHVSTCSPKSELFPKTPPCFLADSSSIYPNSRLSFTDIEEQWPEDGAERWHLVHCRMLAGSIASWPQLYNQIYQYACCDSSLWEAL